MRTFAEMGWNQWTGPGLIYSYGLYLVYLRIWITTRRKGRRP